MNNMTETLKKQLHLVSNQWLEVLDELNIGAMTVDLDHHITAINHCAQALIGLRVNEVLRCDCREVFTGVPCRVHCILDTNRRDGYSDASLHFVDEEDHEYTVTRIATPILDNRDQVAGCLTILQDHSPISDLIDRLRYEERSLKNILDSLDLGVFTVNRSGLLTFFNTAAEKISGYHRDQVLGKPCGTLFESNDSEGICLIKDALDNNGTRRLHEGHLVDRYGDRIPIRATCMALKDEKEVVVGGLATFKDLTLIHQLNQAINKRFSFRDMIGKSPRMQHLFDMVPVVSTSDATVLIEGATGTGKDLLAKIIHSTSKRREKPWVKINCAAVPENLLESEFFGYAKGAFTGADHDKPGLFKEADGGTIFLDEIGDLPLSLQAKLLRVLEDKEFYPLGSRKTQKVDVRIISATNRNLEKLVRKRHFREDLFYRLNVVRMELPPLIQRREDVPLLIRSVLRKLSAVRAMTPPAVSQTAMQILLNYTYPGNVREMENIIEHAMILCRQEAIEERHLPDYIRTVRDATPSESGLDSDPIHSVSEKNRISAILNKYQGHRGKAARELGIDRTTLWRKMKRIGL